MPLYVLFGERIALRVGRDFTAQDHDPFDEAPDTADAAGDQGNDDADDALLGIPQIELVNPPRRPGKSRADPPPFCFSDSCKSLQRKYAKFPDGILSIKKADRPPHGLNSQAPFIHFTQSEPKKDARFFDKNRSGISIAYLFSGCQVNDANFSHKIFMRFYFIMEPAGPDERVGGFRRCRLLERGGQF